MTDARRAGNEAQHWLLCLKFLLGDLAPDELCLLHLPLNEELRRCLGRPPPAQVLVSSTDSPSCGNGWLLRLDDASARICTLYIGADHADLWSSAQLRRAAILCRAAWALAPDRDSTTPLDADGGAMHDLRNALNAVVMNAALLGQTALPPAARETLHELEADLKRSVAALERVDPAMG